MDWRKKLEAEYEENIEKIERLFRAICEADAGKRNDISEKQLLLMKCQFEAMTAVERILQVRLEESE